MTTHIHSEGNASLLVPWEEEEKERVKLLHTVTVFIPRQSAVCTDSKSLEKRKPSFLE